MTLNDHTDAEIDRRAYLYEMSVQTTREQRWFKFCQDVEKLIGLDLDGDDATDGFSIDGALAAYDKGLKPVDYANAVCRARHELGLL